ncbi:thiol-disulfide isomerase/thioredoxin [Pedobacter sp. AK017]|uniref:TlpA family protein disulfide reductase n=1 Tax=Pedobacter sp. AK017 TaxID=2723073 RepID=UPI001616573F|nr:TlpA disulfide reductase family protein [Pedobacter sp. AK017]MBB5440081.1 thiol-disulfide isomerase/thioredoxin [Pedobacter sp. AK017]
MKKYITIFLGILVFLDIYSFAQKAKDRDIQSRPVTFKLKVVNYLKVPDTMSILLMTDPLKIGDGDTYIAIRDSSNQFTFKLPILKAPARLFIKTIINPNILREYWVEPSDDVLLAIKAQGKNTLINVTGYGGGKYRYSVFLDSAYKANRRIGKRHPYSPELLNNDISFSDTTFSFGKAILDKFKQDITPAMYKILHAEFVGKNIKTKWTYASIYKSAAPIDSGITNRILALEKEPIIDTVSISAAISAPNYIDGSKLAAIIYNKTRYAGANSVIAQTYDYLKAKYTGALQEYLITSYLIDRPKGSSTEFKSVLIDAVSFVKDKKLNSRLHELLSALSYDSSSYPHIFMDAEGKNRTLAEWKGKVILIDFWFNGCVPCKHFSKVFEEKILPVFKDSREVIFIGINIDQDKKKWISGIKSKEYTSDETINLSTLGLGFAHPFPKMFNVMSAPTLFLIGKDGRLITSNLTKDADQIIQQIKNAILK